MDSRLRGNDNKNVSILSGRGLPLHVRKENDFVKAMLQRWKIPLFIMLFFSLIVTSLFSPIASNVKVPNMPDLINHLAFIIQGKMAFLEGQFPLRIAPNEQMGWRYPLYQFYSPTAYTYTSLIYRWLVPNNPFIVYKIAMWTAIMLGGIYMQILAYWFLRSRPAAILAGVIYITSPYYLIVMHHFGDLTESMALGIIPAAIYYTLLHFLQPHSNKTLLQASLAWYLLLTIHVVSFIYTGFFVGIFLTLLTLRNPNHIKNFFKVGIVAALVCLLAMWYLVPIVSFEKYFYLAATYQNGKEFTDYGPFLANLLSLTGGSSTSFTHGNIATSIHPGIGWPILLAACVAFYAFFDKAKIASMRANYLLPFLLILFLLAFVMTWSPFNFWKWLPHVLLVGQYTWRFLDQLIWIGALLFAWSFCWLFKNKLDVAHILIGTLLCFLATSSWIPFFEKPTSSIDAVLRNPRMIFSPTAYLIDVNRNTSFVSAVDNLQLSSIVPAGTLLLNENYFIPQKLLSYASNPTVELAGSVDEETLKKNLLLVATINGAYVTSIPLNKKSYDWIFPINKQKEIYKNKKMLALKFNLLANNKPLQKDVRLDLKKIISSAIYLKKNTIDLKMSRAILSGFLPSSEWIGLNEMKKYCHLKGDVTVCELDVPKQVHLLELPIIFYPDLMHITLNGKNISYRGIQSGNDLLTAISPQGGEKNVIKIQFIGSVWANTVSRFAWGLYGMILLGVIFHARRLIRSLIIPSTDSRVTNFSKCE